MTNWVKAPNVVSFFNAFNELAPERDKSSDGTIGDAAHWSRKSSHNPDDTPGSLSEYTDADSIPEVRGADVDSDLRQSGLTMEMCVQALLDTPEDLKRGKYIIFNRRIWSKSNSWKQQSYTGTDPHTGHLHFSGDPASDDNGSRWTFVDKLKGDIMNADQARELHAVFTGMFAGGSSMGRSVDPDGDGPSKAGNSLVAKLDYLLDRVDALEKQSPVTIDYDQLADAIVRRVFTVNTQG